MTPPWTIKLAALFVLIQIVSLILTVCGIPICAVLALGNLWTYDYQSDRAHWKYQWAWIWDNDEDGIAPHWYNFPMSRWKIFVWTALRNSCNNLRYVRGVSAPGRPLWYRTWTMRVPAFDWNDPIDAPCIVWIHKQFYAKAGWAAHTGWPMISAGGGRGY